MFYNKSTQRWKHPICSLSVPSIMPHYCTLSLILFSVTFVLGSGWIHNLFPQLLNPWEKHITGDIACTVYTPYYAQSCMLPRRGGGIRCDINSQIDIYIYNYLQTLNFQRCFVFMSKTSSDIWQSSDNNCTKYSTTRTSEHKYPKNSIQRACFSVLIL